MLSLSLAWVDSSSIYRAGDDKFPLLAGWQQVCWRWQMLYKCAVYFIERLKVGRRRCTAVLCCKIRPILVHYSRGRPFSLAGLSHNKERVTSFFTLTKCPSLAALTFFFTFKSSGVVQKRVPDTSNVWWWQSETWESSTLLFLTYCT